MRHGRLLACLLFALGLLTFVGGAAGAGGVDLTGTWSCCGPGGAGQQDFVITAGSGSISGTGTTPGGSEFATLSGSISGSSVRIVTTYTTDVGYVATFAGTVSAGGTTMSGSWTSNQKQSGTWTATRVGGAPGTPTTDTTTTETQPGQTTTTTPGSPGLIPDETQDLDSADTTATGCQQSLDSDDPSGVINGVRQTGTVRSLASAMRSGSAALSNQPTYSSAGEAIYHATEACVGGTLAVGGAIAKWGGAAATAFGLTTATYAAMTTPLTGPAAIAVAGPGLATAGAGAVIGGTGAVAQHVGDGILNDPADSGFRVIAQPAPVEALVWPSKSGISARAIQTITRLRAALGGAASLSNAMLISIDRATGAKKARNSLWEGRQIRAVISYDHRLRVLLHSVRVLWPTLVSELPAKVLHQTITASQIAAAKKLVRQGKLPAANVKFAAGLGISEAKLKASILALPGKTTTVDLAAGLDDPFLIPFLKIADAGLALYTKVPQIVQESKLH